MSPFNQALKHQDTMDIRPPLERSKRTLFKVPLRQPQFPSGDEEKGFDVRDAESQYIVTPAHQPQIAQELHEIVQSRWISNEDGEEDVVLTLEDAVQNTKGADVTEHAFWLHLKSPAPTMQQFQKQAAEIPGLHRSEVTLVVRLMKKMEKGEQSFVHGKFLEPMTVTYEGEDPDRGNDSVSGVATFFCFPYFALESLAEHTFGSKNSTHPIRPLLQTQSRLESTSQRDKNQVFRKTISSNDTLHVHVPQVWALVINQHILVTCAPYDMSILCGRRIEMIMNSQMEAENQPRPIEYTNLLGKKFFIPLKKCKTWADLANQVSRPAFVPPPWSSSFVREQLLNGGTRYKLECSLSSEALNDSSWADLLQTNGGNSIQLFLVEKKGSLRSRSMGFEGRIAEKVDAFDEHPLIRKSIATDARPGALRTPPWFPLFLRANPKAKSLSTKTWIKRRPINDSISDETLSEHSGELVVSGGSPKGVYTESSAQSASREAQQSNNHSIAPNAKRPTTEPSGRPTNAVFQEQPDGEPGEIRAPQDKILTNVLKNQECEPSKETLDVQSSGEGSPRKRSGDSDKNNHNNLRKGSTSDQSVRNEHKVELSPSSRSSHVSPHHDDPADDTIKEMEMSDKEGSWVVYPEEIGPSTCGDATSVDTIDPNNPIFLWSSGQYHVVRPSNTRSARKTPYNAASTTADQSKVREGILHAILAECHYRLKSSKASDTSKAYRSVREVDENTVIDLVTLYEQRARKLNKTIKEKHEEGSSVLELLDKKRLLDKKQHIYRLSDALIRAFVPPGHDVKIIRKCWGSLLDLLSLAKESHDLAELERCLGNLTKLIANIRNGVRDSIKFSDVHFQMPKAFPIAFQQLILVFVTTRAILASRNSLHLSTSWLAFMRASRECQQRLLEGRTQLDLMLYTDDYRDHAGFEDVDAASLLSIMANNLLNLPSEKDGFHIVDKYTEYMGKIHKVVRESASVRVYADIELLSEELDAIKLTLEKQYTALWDLRCNLKDSSTTSGLFTTVLDRMLAQVLGQGEDFAELQHQAESARHRAAQSISLKAESNNKAILVFTTVTIIFLPLSFVTSYLGMNTADIRSTNSSQNLFWATGLPVTLVVLAIAWAVAYVEEVKSFVKTLKARLMGKDKAD